MNNVCLIGRMTREPELRSTETGTSVCSFSLAVQRSFKNKDGEYEADFINCVAWRNTAEFISKYFKKGQQIGVKGEIQTRKWDDNGTTRYATEVIVTGTTFVGKNSSDSKDERILPEAELPVIPDEDLPF